jgi:hypothetical protein
MPGSRRWSRRDRTVCDRVWGAHLVEQVAAMVVHSAHCVHDVGGAHRAGKRAERLHHRAGIGIRHDRVPRTSSHTSVRVRTSRARTSSQPGQRTTMPGARL